MLRGIKVLDQAKLVEDPRWWNHQSIHPGNEARHAAGEMHLVRSAASSKKLLYKWRLRLPKSIQAMNLRPNVVAALYANKPEAWQQFLEGAPVMSTANVNVAVGLTNGAIGTAYALYFSAADRAKVAEAERRAVESGSWVVEVPLGVFPTIFELAFPVPPNVEDRGQLHGRIEQEKWIVPFEPCWLDAIQVLAKDKSVTVKPHGFKLTQALALTFHKSQGLTIAPVVLDLARTAGRKGGCSVTFESLYVGLSRAPSDNSLRLLPPAEGQTLEYLLGLKPKKDTVEYLEHGWDLDSGRRAFAGAAAALVAVRRARAPDVAAVARKAPPKPAAKKVAAKKPAAKK